MKAKILVVDDDSSLVMACRKVLEEADYDVAGANSSREGLDKILSDESIDILLADVRMPGFDGMTLLEKVKSARPGVEVVIMTGYGSIQNAVAAIKLGAADYITKPFSGDEIVHALDKISTIHQLRSEVDRLRNIVEGRYGFKGIVGRSSAMQEVLARADAASRNNSPVFIAGESGTGKELVARAIHHAGKRAHGPFIAVNCGALPDELVESELFGHKKGAFTGATNSSEGLFRAANGGTIFLDEIAEMPRDAQTKLLRVLQEYSVRPVGEVKEYPVDVRVIAATNTDVHDVLEKGVLRKDLYYRLGVVNIRIPPLRERPEDITFLVQHFLERFNSRFSNKITCINSDAMDVLASYSWPGNVRELENLLEGLFAIGESGEITPARLPAKIRNRPPSAGAAGSGKGRLLSEAEKEAIVRALEATDWNKSRAADLLGISRSRLYKKIADYAIRESA